MAGTLDGKRAIVTGAGQGIGRSIALALAAEGAAVALAGRTEATLLAVAAEISKPGGTALPLVADVTRPADIQRVVADTVRELGGIDILVNNAQIPALGTLLDVTDEAFAACWESGPRAAFRLMRACHPHLNPGSVIINLGSSAAVNPQPAWPRGLRRGQGGDRDPEPGGRRRVGTGGHPGDHRPARRDQPGVGGLAAGQSGGVPAQHVEHPAAPAGRPGGGDRPGGGLPVRAGGELHHRHHDRPGRRPGLPALTAGPRRPARCQRPVNSGGLRARNAASPSPRSAVPNSIETDSPS